MMQHTKLSSISSNNNSSGLHTTFCKISILNSMVERPRTSNM